MTNATVHCPSTKWFMSRAILMGLLFLGFSGYFFYDASIGYPSKNELFCTYQTFVQAGKDFGSTKFSPEEWEKHVQSKTIEFSGLPIPENLMGKEIPWPKELRDYSSMQEQGWNGIWTKYSEQYHLPYKAPEQPLDQGKIKEQWIAGGICLLIFIFCLGLIIRTKHRYMGIEGDTVTAAGKIFSVKDITLIDMRKWKNKGLAHATIETGNQSAKVRFDGLAYGGFNPADAPNTAEDFIRSLLSIYSGKILDYEEEQKTLQEKETSENH